MKNRIKLAKTRISEWLTNGNKNGYLKKLFDAIHKIGIGLFIGSLIAIYNDKANNPWTLVFMIALTVLGVILIVIGSKPFKED